MEFYSCNTRPGTPDDLAQPILEREASREPSSATLRAETSYAQERDLRSSPPLPPPSNYDAQRFACRSEANDGRLGKEHVEGRSRQASSPPSRAVSLSLKSAAVDIAATNSPPAP